MKKIIASIITIALFLTSATACYGAVDGITKDNYDTYEKPNADAYGFNKGECETPYLEGEEFFYNEYYDHWNVEKVYDASLLPKEKATTTTTKVVKKDTKKKKAKKKTNLSIAKAYAKKHYKGYKIKVVKYGKVPKKRTGKKTVYIEKLVTVSDGGKNGHVVKDKSYVRYSKKVSKGSLRICYCVYNPHNNYIDDCVFVNCLRIK